MLGRSKSCTKALDLWSIQSSVSCGACRESYFVADRKQCKSQIYGKIHEATIDAYAIFSFQEV